MTVASERTIREALTRAAGILGDLDDARREAEWLLMETLSCSRTRLFSHADEVVDDDCWLRYRESVHRRAAGEPLAYVLGHCRFRDLALAVSPSVLIPRPETEWLVEEVLQQLPDTALHVVDLGTGSGAIALSLARERRHWQVWATDVSADALRVAQRNALSLELDSVRFVPGSWFDALPAGQRFDAVISNPPYVESGTPALDEDVARHEPALALYAEQRGMSALLHLVAGAPERLRPGGLLALEHGYDQGPGVRAGLTARGYRDISTHRDLAGHERFTIARWRGDDHA